MSTHRPAVAIGGEFHLVDHHGREVSDRTYLGKPVLIFFGFTHCQMVCPETLGRLTRALDLLGDKADQIQPLYITVDPDRDSSEVMREFLQQSYPRFTGLTGDAAEIERVKHHYKVFAQRAERDDGEGYDMPHSAMIFVMGPQGNYVTHFSNATTAEEIAGRLTTILES